MNINYYIKSLTFNKFFKNASNSDISHSYMLISEDESSLPFFSQIFALNLMCLNSEKPCLKCSNCLKILNSNAVDVYYYPKGKNILVGDISEMLDTINLKPMDFDKKIYILNNVHKATIQAQNKLLKTLEEPPRNVIFILTATEENNVLPTIASRCKKLYMPLVDPQEIQQILNEDYINNVNLKVATEASLGYLGKALNILQDNSFIYAYNVVLDMLENMNRVSDVLTYSSKIIEDKGKTEKYLDLLTIFFRDMLVIKAGQKGLINNKSIGLKLETIAEGYSVRAITEILKIILKQKEKLRFNVNPVSIIDNLLVKILEVKYTCK